MADSVTIRNPHTLRERSINRTAIPFFPGWEVLDSIGRVNPKAAPAPAPAKENN